MAPEHFDVLVVGAGIAGIDAAYRLQTECPDRSFAVLEGRSDLGGTWDLFRFPGIRSDSDMYTLGFPFRPWTGSTSIADGASIMQYLRDTVAEFGLDRRIRFDHHVSAAAWSSATSTWTVEVEIDGRVGADHVHVQLLVRLRRLLPLRPRLHARAPGHRALRGDGGPSAAMARGSRLPRPARRRDRERRDRGDDGSRHGCRRREGDDAATFAFVLHRAARHATRAATGCTRRCRGGWPMV